MVMQVIIALIVTAAVALILLDMLKSRGIGIYFEEQNIDTLKNESELYLVIYAGFAQAESESMSKNITWSKRKSFEEGKPVYVYNQWLGYKKGADGQPEIVPDEAKIVERIFNMYLSGMTAKAISLTLKSENIHIQGKNTTFSKQMVMNALKNEKYCGDCILQKTVTIDCISKTRRKNTGEAPMYYVQNCHPAIISREIFNKAQEENARRKAKAPTCGKQATTATGKYSKYALGEVLVCAECGTRYRRNTWSKRGIKKIMWRCGNRIDYGTRYCRHSPSLEESKLHEAVVRALNKFNENDRGTYLVLMRATIGEAIGLNGGEEEISLLERKVESLNRKTLELVNDSIRNGTDISEYDEELRNIAEEAEAMKRRIKIIRQTQDDGLNDERLMTIQKTIEERDRHQDRYDDSIVRQMIECIKVHTDGSIEVIFGGGIVIEEKVLKQTK